jgi:Protein of unknown function (DUF3617)
MLAMDVTEPRQRPTLRSRAAAGVIGVTYLLGCAGLGMLCASKAATAAAPTVNDVTLPKFQPGLWQYQRTLTTGSGKPQVTVVKKCTSPSAEIEKKMTALRGKSCRFTAVRRENDHYVSGWMCPTPSGPMQFRDVLSAKNATAYQDVSEARLGQHVTQQRIEATRLGDCTVAPMVPAAPSVSAIEHDSTAATR